MLFGIPESKDATGSGGIDPAGVLNLAITDVVAEVGDQLTVMSDLCLDEFTDHGHCGLVTPDGVARTTRRSRRTPTWRAPRPRPASTWSAPAA